MIILTPFHFHVDIFDMSFHVVFVGKQLRAAGDAASKRERDSIASSDSVQDEDCGDQDSP